MVSNSDRRAPMGQLESLFAFWEESLWESRFFGGDRAVHSAYGEVEGREQERSRAASAMSKLRRLIQRAEPSIGEASLLRGALQSLVAAARSKKTSPDAQAVEE